MTENFTQAQYDVTKKSKLRIFYESNKILIYSFILILIFFFVSFIFYLENKQKKKDFIIRKLYTSKNLS